MIGRRGPAQAKFTTKELRELGELPGVDIIVGRRRRPTWTRSTPTGRQRRGWPSPTAGSAATVAVIRDWAAPGRRTGRAARAR